MKATKEAITAADQALTTAAYAVRKAKTDPSNRAAWLSSAADSIAAAAAAVKTASAPAPKPAKKAPAPKPAKKAKK